MKTLAIPEVKQEIIERVRRVQPDSPRRWGIMTAPQMICHLADSFRGVTGEKGTRMAKGIPMRGLIKFFALRVPLPWPHGVPTLPEMDQVKGGGTPPSEFKSDVLELERLVNKITAIPRKFEWAPHPIFSRMNEQEWMRWSYLHMDHHLRQFGV